MWKKYKWDVSYLDEVIEAEGEVLEGQGDIGEQAQNLVCRGPEVDLLESVLQLSLELVCNPLGAEHFLLSVLASIKSINQWEACV